MYHYILVLVLYTSISQLDIFWSNKMFYLHSVILFFFHWKIFNGYTLTIFLLLWIRSIGTLKWMEKFMLVISIKIFHVFLLKYCRGNISDFANLSNFDNMVAERCQISSDWFESHWWLHNCKIMCSPNMDNRRIQRHQFSLKDIYDFIISASCDLDKLL